MNLKYQDTLVTVSNLLLTLHRGARERPIHEFQDWLLHQIRTILPFDEAVYGMAAHLDGSGPTVLTLHGYQTIHADANAQKARILAALNHPPAATDTTDTTDTIVYADAEGTERPAHQTMAATWTNPATTTTTVISLLRHAPAEPFDPHHQTLLQALVPHMAFATKCNRIAHVRTILHPEAHPGCAVALVDAAGVLHLAERRFTDLLQAAWPNWRGPQLPKTLIDDLNRCGNKCVLVGCTAFRRMQHDDFQLVLARAQCPMDTLTPRERQVAVCYAKGANHKQVADTLCIAPATVRTHLRNIYAKLCVDTKSALAACLAASENRSPPEDEGGRQD